MEVGRANYHSREYILDTPDYFDELKEMWIGDLEFNCFDSEVNIPTRLYQEGIEKIKDILDKDWSLIGDILDHNEEYIDALKCALIKHGIFLPHIKKESK